MKIPKELNAGRPRSAVDKAMLPEKPLKPEQPKVAHVPKVSGELPKEVIGSHMGHMAVSTKGPAIKGPPSRSPRMRKGPPA